MAELEVNASKDADINITNPDYANGGHANLRVEDYLGSGDDQFIVISFDISALPVRSAILRADLKLYLASSSAEGNTHWVYKLTTTDWVESEVTFNNKASGQTWASGAISTADWTTSNGVSLVIPALPPSAYMTWEIKDIVQDAFDNSIDVNLIVMGVTPETGTGIYVSRNSGFVPVLTITYVQTTVYPAYDALARVSSIRHICQPGSFRMQVGLGDLGFDVDVAEATVRSALDTAKEVVEEPAEPSVAKPPAAPLSLPPSDVTPPEPGGLTDYAKKIMKKPAAQALVARIKGLELGVETVVTPYAIDVLRRKEAEAKKLIDLQRIQKAAAVPGITSYARTVLIKRAIQLKQELEAMYNKYNLGGT